MLELGNELMASSSCDAFRASLAVRERHARLNSPVTVVVVTLSEAVVAVTVAVSVLVDVDGACVVVAVRHQ